MAPKSTHQTSPIAPKTNTSRAYHESLMAEPPKQTSTLLKRTQPCEKHRTAFTALQHRTVGAGAVGALLDCTCTTVSRVAPQMLEYEVVAFGVVIGSISPAGQRLEFTILSGRLKQSQAPKTGTSHTAEQHVLRQTHMRPIILCRDKQTCKGQTIASQPPHAYRFE